MALAASLAGLPRGAGVATRRAKGMGLGRVDSRLHPRAAALVVPTATNFVVPRNQHPAHWPGTMQIVDGIRTDRFPPWNYKERTFAGLNTVFDTTTDRFDEYSRVIVVDGNIGSGKSTVAKEIAEKFDMLYVPEPNCALMNSGDPPTNADMRSSAIQKRLHPRNRKYDLSDFYMDPHKKPYRAAELQMNFYEWRYHQYTEACLHLLSTGQGVVLDRSIYSDFVFLEALRDQGLIPRRVHNWYYHWKFNTICNFWRPHLVVYLDTPVDVCMERIKKRGIDYEVCSSFLNEDYLASIEKHYKERFLPDMEPTGELVVSEWPDHEDPEMIIEEISRLEFKYEIDDAKKFADWRDKTEAETSRYRHECSDPVFAESWLRGDGCRQNGVGPGFGLFHGKYRVPELWKDGQLSQEYEVVRRDTMGTLEDDPKLGLFSTSTQIGRFKFLDNLSTPILGDKYVNPGTRNNPLEDAMPQIARA